MRIELDNRDLHILRDLVIAAKIVNEKYPKLWKKTETEIKEHVSLFKF